MQASRAIPIGSREENDNSTVLIGQRCAELTSRKRVTSVYPTWLLVALVHLCKGVCDQTAIRLPPEAWLLGKGVALGTAKSLLRHLRATVLVSLRVDE